MKRTYQIAIIGGGIVGVAIARELGLRFKDILLLEKEDRVAVHTSGRNSGVIHSGINPRPGTLKAQLCVEGSKLMREYCREEGVPFEQNGTLVVAADEAQRSTLQELKSRSQKNGVPGVEILAPSEFHALEPNAKGIAALYSPTGAIVDSVALTQSLAREAQARGVDLIFNESVLRLKESGASIEIHCREEVYTAQFVINCAGLQVDRLAHQVGVALNYTIVPFRGEYFVTTSAAASLVRSMIYPVPDLRFPFLGVHLTKTTSGALLIGPNAVPALGRECYSSRQFAVRDLWDMVRHQGFWNALRHNSDLRTVAWHELQNSYSRKHFLGQAARLVDKLALRDLTIEKRAGMRAQLIRSDGELVEDLVIETTPHSVHLLNVISPGMTSSLAFAGWFSRQFDGQGRWSGSSSNPA